MGVGLFSKNGGKYEIDMSSGPIMPKMLLFAVPLVCSGILQLLFNTADVIVVGRFAGDHSLAAVGSNGSLIGLLTNLFIGLSVGTNVLAARYYGARDEESLARTIHTSMLVGAASGLLLMAGGMICARRILILMRTPEEVLRLATLYLVIYFMSMPAMMLYNFGSAVLRAVGDTRRPLLYLTAAGVVNVLLNLFFVVNLRLDVAGVALATVISQFISAALVVRCLMREKGALRLSLSELRISTDKLLMIMRIGVPAGLQGVIFSLSNVVIQSTINSFGAVVMAGNSAALNLELYIYFAQNAFYQAILSFTSQNYGAGRVKRIYKVLRSGIICTIATGGILSALFVIFGRDLLGIYSTSGNVIGAGMKRILILCSTYPLCGVMEAMAGVVRGLGFSVAPTIVSLIGSCVLRLVWIAAVFRVEALRTVSVVYLSYPVSWVITSTAHFICFRWIMKNRILPEARAAVLMRHRPEEG
ncbi:MAG: MATE family efflux transporter [Synergistes sp.]|nr:MATE family efflux transporter [Synergistes sp.]